MADEQTPQEPSTLAMALEIGAVHAVGAALIRIFFRWQGSKHSFWEAGDESMIANGLNGGFDVLYWVLKPRLMKWRNG